MLRVRGGGEGWRGVGNEHRQKKNYNYELSESRPCSMQIAELTITHDVQTWPVAFGSPFAFSSSSRVSARSVLSSQTAVVGSFLIPLKRSLIN